MFAAAGGRVAAAERVAQAVKAAEEVAARGSRRRRQRKAPEEEGRDLDVIKDLDMGDGLAVHAERVKEEMQKGPGEKGKEGETTFQALTLQN